MKSEKATYSTSGAAKGTYSADDVEHALAALIGSTKRRFRSLTLLEVAHYIEVALSAYDGFPALADAIDVSPETLRRFLRARRLCPSVKRLIVEGAISSIDIADSLGRLPGKDQPTVAKSVLRGELSSEDVRAVVSIRKDLPEEKIAFLIDRVKSSRNIKHYVIEFLIPDCTTVKDVRKSFATALGVDNIVSFGKSGGIHIITLTADGQRRLSEMARQVKLTKRRLVDKILRGSKGPAIEHVLMC